MKYSHKKEITKSNPLWLSTKSGVIDSQSIDYLGLKQFPFKQDETSVSINLKGREEPFFVEPWTKNELLRHVKKPSFEAGAIKMLYVIRGDAGALELAFINSRKDSATGAVDITIETVSPLYFPQYNKG